MRSVAPGQVVGMHRRSGTTRRRAAGTAAAIAVVAGGAMLARRRRATPAPAGSGRTPLVDPDQRYTCACGATYGVSGSGRHRVFWPAEGEPADAILEDHCPACEQPWPAEETPATA
jgi:hypothetical protein